MVAEKTVAIFGAGGGLGASLALRFGREGYRVALVARRPEPLEEMVGTLAQQGIEAVAFPGDLAQLEAIPSLVQTIEEQMGRIDVAIFSPAPLGNAFVPAAMLNAAFLRSMTDIYMLAPVETVRTVLQGMIGRGDGAIVLVSGLTAVMPIPGMSGSGPLMAAARNYILTLNAEMSGKGVFAGTINIGGIIERSAFHRLASESGALDPNFPVVDPDDIAHEILSLITNRSQPETTFPLLS